MPGCILCEVISHNLRYKLGRGGFCGVSKPVVLAGVRDGRLRRRLHIRRQIICTQQEVVQSAEEETEWTPDDALRFQSFWFAVSRALDKVSVSCSRPQQGSIATPAFAVESSSLQQYH